MKKSLAILMTVLVAAMLTSRSFAAPPTGHARDINKGHEAGFFRYLTKPIKVIEFMEAVDVALDVSRAASAIENKAVQTTKEPRDDQHLRHA